MAKTIREVIEKPHPDIELGYIRDELEYFITFPDSGINSNTGIVLSVCGYGDTADSEYQLNKLRPYLADKYNCLVVGVNYFGIRLEKQLNNLEFLGHFCGRYNVPHSFFGDEQGQLKMSLDDVYANMYMTLYKKDINYLDSRCRPEFSYVKEYHNFGLLPAIDNLMVLGQVLNKYEVNQRRIIAFGSSYGGYISILMGKFAPHTFSTIIDNSGFSRIRPEDILDSEIVCEGNAIRTYKINDKVYNFQVSVKNPWTIKHEDSPYYLSDSCRRIRSLLVKEHRINSETRYYIFHSPEDQVAPISDKDTAVEVLGLSNQVYYKRISPEDIDGRLFKNLSHGMNASLREMFDLVAGLDEGELCKSHLENDFSLNHTYTFCCGDADYKFCFDNEYTVQVSRKIVSPGIILTDQR